MVEIDEAGRELLHAFLKQEHDDAVAANDEAGIATFESQLEKFNQNVSQLEEKPLEAPACFVCNNHPEFKLPSGLTCASCGCPLNQKGYPAGGIVSYYPRDKNGIPREIGTGTRDIDTGVGPKGDTVN